MANKPEPRATNLSARRRAHPAIPVENRADAHVEPVEPTETPSSSTKPEPEAAGPDLTDDPGARTAQVSARVTRARRAAFKAKLAQLGTTMDAEINKCIDDVLSR